MKIIADSAIPFLRGVLEPFAEVEYLPGTAISAAAVHDADALVVMLRRGSENVIPNGDTAIQAGDLMVLSTPLYEDDDGVSLREVPVAEHGDWIGRPIKELGIPAEVLIVLVRRADGTTVVPKGGTVLQQGDMLVVNEWEET